MSAARNIVRNVLGTAAKPLSVREIYQLAIEKFPVSTTQTRAPASDLHASLKQTILKDKPHVERQTPPRPPSDSHPIQSMNHLKHRVLPMLESFQEIQKAHFKKAPSGELIPPTKGKDQSHSLPMAERSKLVSTWLWTRHPQTPHPIPSSPEVPEPLQSLSEDRRTPPKGQYDMYPDPRNNHLNRRRRAARAPKEAAQRKQRAEFLRNLTEKEPSIDV